MSALFDITVDSISSTAGLVAGALIVLAAVLPKILNSIKGDSIEGTVLQRISRHEKRMTELFTNRLYTLPALRLLFCTL